MSSVNLWECLTRCDSLNRRNESAPNVPEGILEELHKCSRFYGQEIRLEPTEEGWKIRIEHCDDSHLSYGSGVEILITKDHREPCRIIKDRIGIREYHHRE